VTLSTLTLYDTVSHYVPVAHASAPEVRGAHFIIRGLIGFAVRAAGCAMMIIAIVACLVGLVRAAGGAAEVGPAQGDKPSFTLRDLNGAENALSALRGRVVLVHFFATWCESCRDELPALSRLVERARDRNLDVIAISVAEVPLRVRRFIEQTPLNYPVLLDEDRAVAKAWSVDTLPTSFILDAELKVRLAVESDCRWDELDVTQLLEKLAREERQ
jgi:peroxiredoxin